MYDARPIAHAQVLDALRTAAASLDRGDGLHPTVSDPIPHSVRVQEAAALGRTISEHARPSHPSAIAYASLARSVADSLSA